VSDEMTLSDAEIVKALRNWHLVWKVVSDWAAPRSHYDENSERLLAQHRADYFQQLASGFGEFIEKFVAPRLGQVSRPILASSSIGYEDVAAALRCLKKLTQARLVEYMADKDYARCLDVADIVHDDRDASEQTIRMNARRTNEALINLGLPLSFSVRGGYVHKEWREA
jgi:hypothetical protein